MNRSRMKTKFSMYVLLSIFLLMFLPNLATATIITGGEVVPAYPAGDPDPWDIQVDPTGDPPDFSWADLIIGNTGIGSLEINDFSEINDSSGYIGFGPSSSGTVDVDSAGWNNYHTWDADEETYWGGDLYVGYEGTGVMNIFDDGYVYNDANGYIAFAPGSSGTVNVNDELWEIHGDLYVGYEGTGVMNIFNVGYVYNDANGYIAFAPGSSGTVDVDDADWDIYGDLHVGHGGTGTMVISNSGYVYVDDTAWIGYEPNSIGSVTVTGGQEGEGWDPSDWYISDELVVGYEGQGTLLVEDGGYVNVGGDDSVYIGGMPGSTGSVTVTGHTVYDEDEDGLFLGPESYQDRSRLESDGELVVGVEGDGELMISDGGYVYTSDDGYIGDDKGSSGLVTVTGRGFYQEDANETSNDLRYIDGSEWEIDESLYVGDGGDGELMISDGGLVTSNGGYIGRESGSRGMVTVTGPAVWQERPGELYPFWIDGSRWYAGEELVVGDHGEGELMISDGGQVWNGDGYIAAGMIGQGRVTVTGPNSVWGNEGYLFVAGHDEEEDGMPMGGEGELLIEDGGRVESYTGFIGVGDYARGRVAVTGPNSVWNNYGDLLVGGAEDYQGWIDAGGEGELLISDRGRVYTADSAYIGSNGFGRVTVTGPNSVWEIGNGNEGESGELCVGEFGHADGELLISDGGRVTSKVGSIGTHGEGHYGHYGDYYPFSGVVTVTGPNSVWENEYQIYIGGDGTEGDYDLDKEVPRGTGMLNILDGGVVEAGSVAIGPNGTLSGDGTLRLTANSVLSYGTIKPGNSIGTLTIDGDLRIREDSVLEVEIDNSGNSDLLFVTGDVNIVGGIVQPVPTESILGAQEYTIVEANSVEGEFDTVDTALLDLGILLSDASLGYEPNLVTLDINAKRFDDPSIVKSDNQSSLGGALQKITEGGGNSITTALQALESADDVRDAYKQLSGQIRPQLMPVASVDASKFMGVVSDRMNPTNQGLSYFGPGSGPLLAMANPDATNDNRSMSDTSPNFAVGNGTAKFSDQKLGFWGKGYGIFGDRDSGGGVSGYDYTIYGTSFGLDYQITDSSLLGITVGYSESNMDSSLSGNKGDISSNHIGIYGNKNTEDWHFDSILACSFLEYETKRYVNFVNERLDGDTDGQGISGYVEARYDWRNLDRWLLQPLASFQFSLLDIDSYTEDGCHGCETGDTSSLGFDSQRYDSYKGSLGLKMTKNIFNQSNENRANIQLRGRWVHEFGDDNSSVDAHFASDPGAVFKVSDEDISRDSFILGAGINADLGRHTRFSFGYDTQLNSDDNMHLLSAMFMYRW